MGTLKIRGSMTSLLTFWQGSLEVVPVKRITGNPKVRFLWFNYIWEWFYLSLCLCFFICTRHVISWTLKLTPLPYGNSTKWLTILASVSRDKHSNCLPCNLHRLSTSFSCWSSSSSHLNLGTAVVESENPPAFFFEWQPYHEAHPSGLTAVKRISKLIVKASIDTRDSLIALVNRPKGLSLTQCSARQKPWPSDIPHHG